MKLSEATDYLKVMKNHHRAMRDALKALDLAIWTGSPQTLGDIADKDAAYAETVRAAWEDAGTLSRNILTDSMNRYKE